MRQNDSLTTAEAAKKKMKRRTDEHHQDRAGPSGPGWSVPVDLVFCLFLSPERVILFKVK